MLGLEGKSVLVTGAANGIGRACVLAFAEAGAQVVAADLDLVGVQETVAESEQLGGRAVAVACDVRDESQVQAAFDTAESTFGGLDVAVNNVGGMLGEPPTPTLEVELKAWKELVELNLDSIFLCCRAAGNLMVRHGRAGSIINLGAVIGISNSAQLAAYGAAKAGVSQFTQTLAVELGPQGIRVNCVAPAFTETAATKRFASPERKALTTGAIPLGRVAEAQEMAGVVVFLASDLATFVNGQTIAVDGGLTCTTLRLPRGMEGPAPWQHQ